jgi:glycosyltransferase involved in cell wall biosynthesis
MQSPLLSVCIPAYNRPVWLERAIKSVAVSDQRQNIEIIITDDSSNPTCEEVAKEILSKWQGQWRYVHNQPRLGMANNWNKSIQLAKANYVLILHDDDFMFEGAIQTVVDTIEKSRGQYPVLLFGVKVVDENENLIKHQKFDKIKELSPRDALARLLSNSSFIRFPAIVIKREVFENLGYFKSDLDGPADFEMWVRILGNLGTICISKTTCAYTVHAEALTMNMFTQETVERLLSIFQQAYGLNLFKDKEFEQHKSNFFHQFILAGTFRQLKRKNFQKASEVMQLFKIDKISQLAQSRKWFILRLIFESITYFGKTQRG